MKRYIAATFSAALIPYLVIFGTWQVMAAFTPSKSDDYLFAPLGITVFILNWVFAVFIAGPLFILADQRIGLTSRRAFFAGVIAGLFFWLSLSLIFGVTRLNRMPFVDGWPIQSLGLIAFFVSIYGALGGLAFWDMWSRFHDRNLTRKLIAVALIGVVLIGPLLYARTWYRDLPANRIVGVMDVQVSPWSETLLDRREATPGGFVHHIILRVSDSSKDEALEACPKDNRVEPGPHFEIFDSLLLADDLKPVKWALGQTPACLIVIARDIGSSQAQRILLIDNGYVIYKAENEYGPGFNVIPERLPPFDESTRDEVFTEPPK